MPPRRPRVRLVRRLVAGCMSAAFAMGLLAASALPAAGAWPPGRPSAKITVAQSAVLVTHGPRDRKVVALTFDDGYNRDACAALVNVLEATATPATFFPNSMYVAASPDLWRRIALLGFPIGNHTATHPVMPRLTYQEQWDQIQRDRLVVEGVLGELTLSVFRPPYGAFSRSTLLAAEATGYPIVLNWDASFADSSYRPDGRWWPLSSYVRSATRGQSGSVILGHCGNQIDLAVLKRVIASYRSRGFSFVTVPELLDLPGAVPMHFPSPPASPPPSPPPARM